MAHTFPDEQQLNDIKNRLREIFIQQGFKSDQLQNDEEDEYILSFSHKKINYQLYIESEENIHYGICSISDCDYSDQFFDPLDQVENIQYFEEFLFQIEEKTFEPYRNLWSDLEKIQSKYEGILEIDFEDIIKEKFDLY